MKYNKITSQKLDQNIYLKSENFDISKEEAINNYGKIFCPYCGIELKIKHGKGALKKTTIPKFQLCRSKNDKHSNECKYHIFAQFNKNPQKTLLQQISFLKSWQNDTKKEPFIGCNKEEQTTNNSTSPNDKIKGDENLFKEWVLLEENGVLNDNKLIISEKSKLLITKENLENDYKKAYILKIDNYSLWKINPNNKIYCSFNNFCKYEDNKGTIPEKNHFDSLRYKKKHENDDGFYKYISERNRKNENTSYWLITNFESFNDKMRILYFYKVYKI